MPACSFSTAFCVLRSWAARRAASIAGVEPASQILSLTHLAAMYSVNALRPVGSVNSNGASCA